MNDGGFTYKYPSDVSDNFSIALSYIWYYSSSKTNSQIPVHSKTTLFENTISTKRGKERAGKTNRTEKEDRKYE